VGSGLGDLHRLMPGALVVDRAFRVLGRGASSFLHRRRPSGVEK
jgi:hypothetical protein